MNREFKPWWVRETKKQKQITNKILATIIVCILATTIGVIAVNKYFKSVSQGVTIKTQGLGVYWDQACTVPCDFIDWGTMNNGTSKQNTTYIRNEGSYIVYLNYSHVNLPSKFQLTLTYQGLDMNKISETLNENMWIQIDWNLTVSGSSGVYSWSTNITATPI